MQGFSNMEAAGQIRPVNPTPTLSYVNLERPIVSFEIYTWKHNYTEMVFVTWTCL